MKNPFFHAVWNSSIAFLIKTIILTVGWTTARLSALYITFVAGRSYNRNYSISFPCRDHLRIETLLRRRARRIVVRAHVHLESPEMIGRQLDLHFDFLQNRLHWHCTYIIISFFRGSVRDEASEIFAGKCSEVTLPVPRCSAERWSRWRTRRRPRADAADLSDARPRKRRTCLYSAASALQQQ